MAIGGAVRLVTLWPDQTTHGKMMKKLVLAGSEFRSNCLASVSFVLLDGSLQLRLRRVVSSNGKRWTTTITLSLSAISSSGSHLSGVTINLDDECGRHSRVNYGTHNELRQSSP